MEQTIKKNIMRRVYTIYAIRALLSVTALKVYGLVAAVVGMGVFVSFSNVLANVPHITETKSFISFVESAFFETEFVVQVLVLLSIALLALVARDLAKHFSNVRTVQA